MEALRFLFLFFLVARHRREQGKIEQVIRRVQGKTPREKAVEHFGPRFVFRGGDFLKCGGHLGDLGQLGDVVNNWGVADAA